MMTFLAMGGYALYVWPAFLITAFILGIQAIRAVHFFRKTIDEVSKQYS